MFSIATVLTVISTAASIARSVAVIATSVATVCSVVVNVCKELGLIKSDMSVEELGDRALQAEEQNIRPENYDSYEEYLNELQNFPLDEEKSKEYSKEEKEFKATEVSSGILVEKYGVGISDLIDQIAKRPSFFDEGRVASYLKEAEKGNLDFKQMSKFFDGELKINDEIVAIKNALIEIDKVLNPSKNEKEIEQEINLERS